MTSTITISATIAPVARRRFPAANARDIMLPSPGRGYSTGPATMISLAIRKYEPFAHDRMLL
jgi:hypothetical protein